jgi:DNA topoisomerase-1
MDLVDAQQARRVLDRLVGYNLSPLLWRKVRGRLSAGRVQSVALRLVVEREREIDAFTPEEYWSIAAELQAEGSEASFIAKLSRIDGQEPVLKAETDVRPIAEDMEQAKYSVLKVKRGERRRKPSAPFITSTLQQEASRRLRLTARRTMSLAQQLYEGIDVGNGGNTGLITYMRTDSTSVSKAAQEEARTYIRGRFGDDFLPAEAPIFKTRARSAQEAHEAIRPTSIGRTPAELKPFLNRDQFRLYELIWKRFVASQMAGAIYDTVSVRVQALSDEHQYLLQASGSTIRFPGFLVLYEATKNNEKTSENGADAAVLTALEEGLVLQLLQLLPEQHFTQPPPRYTEASLVGMLEENGIGRPSTYAPILSTLQQRGYVLRENRKLIPTETGEVVNDLLIDFFSDVIDVNFTARMESRLDQIASGDQAWAEVIGEFYSPFSKQLERAHEEMPEVKAEPEPIGRQCPECGHDLIVRWGRFGKFISCSNFPDCRHTEPWLEKIGVLCPKDGGEIIEKRTRKGRVFYGCENYPTCDYSSWKRPIPQPCPNCSGLLVIANKTEVQCTQCEQRFPIEQIAPEPIHP